MPSTYLLPAEYAAYGVSSATAQQVVQASALIDGYLGRAEGLVWSPDSTGSPAFMASLVPQFTINNVGPIAPGASVVVPFTGPAIAKAGDVVVIDRLDPDACEACQVIGTGAGTITLRTVMNAHDDDSNLEFGMVVVEDRQMQDDRPIVMLSRPNIVRILSGAGRYGYGRRGASNRYATDEFNVLASVAQFGGPPVYEVFDPTLVDLNPTTSAAWIPAGILLAYYSETRLSYVAGFSQAALPTAIKQACANVLNAQGLATNQALNGNIQSITMGATRITRFTNNLMDADTKNILNPYRVRMFG